MLLTLPPLSLAGSSDLHGLGTPPAFILSQDQTLRKVFLALRLSSFNGRPELIVLESLCHSLVVKVPCPKAREYYYSADRLSIPRRNFFADLDFSPIGQTPGGFSSHPWGMNSITPPKRKSRLSWARKALLRVCYNKATKRSWRNGSPHHRPRVRHERILYPDLVREQHRLRQRIQREEAKGDALR